MNKILCWFLMLFSLTVLAQNGYNRKGERLMKANKFNEAASLYKKVADRDTNDVSSWENLARAFVNLGDFQSAEAVYKKLSVHPNANSVNKFNYGQVLRINGKYEEADSAYSSFILAQPTDRRAVEFKNFSAQLTPLLQDQKNYELAGIPENSQASDIGPAYCFGKLVFSSNRNAGAAVKHIDSWSGSGFYDLFEIGGEQSGTKGEPGKLKGKKINRRFNDGPATFSYDGKEMIFTQTNYKHRGPDGIRTLGLYRAEWSTKKGWTNIQPLPFNSYTYDVAQPSLSKDGSRLYFTSDMPGGEGETDLYMSLRNGSTWETPINLGKEINTPGREMFPVISNEGLLFFSSDAKLGLGGLDVYRAEPDGNRFVHVQNLGAPINTRFDDFGYITDETGKAGFLVSNRTGGMGDDDIYKFIKNMESLCGTVADVKTKIALENVTVTATTADGKQTGALTNMKGDFCLQLIPGLEYKLELERQGYSKTERVVSVKATRNEHINLFLEPKGGIALTVDISQAGGGKIEGATAFLINKRTGEVTELHSDSSGSVNFDLFKDEEYDLKVVKKLSGKEGVYDKFVKTISTMGFKESGKMNENAQLTYYDGRYVFDLPNVYFDLNSSTIKPLAAKDLDKVVDVMKTFPDMQVELSAHTDSRGNAAFNLILSAKRAGNCVDYLVSKGVNKTHLIAIGYGEEKIRNRCAEGVQCSEVEHAVNRRTEFKVVKFD